MSVAWPEELRVSLAAAQSELDRTRALIELVEWLAAADPWAARPRAVEALEAAHRLNDPALLAHAHRAHARSLLFTRGPREAFDEVTKARALSYELGDRHGLAWCDHLTGSTLEFLGDPGGATVHLERALAGFRDVGDLVGQTRTLTALGNGEQFCGRYVEALNLHCQANDLAIAASDMVGANLATLNCGLARAHLGVLAAKNHDIDNARARFHTALDDYRRAYSQARDVGDVSTEPLALARQVLPLCWLGHNGVAESIAEQAMERAGELRLDHHLATALQAAGMANVVVGKLPRAIDFLRRAMALYGQWDLTHDTAAVLRLLVEAYDRGGDVAAALATHKQLLEAELRLRDKLAERDDLVAVARLEAERIEPERDSRLRLAQLARVNRRLEDERRAMERLAHTDGLTGLANRRHCDAQLARSLVQAELTGAPLSIIVVDIDHFKKINDEHSHITGDNVLRAVARELGRHCRASDLACRVGGEEFAVLLPATELKDAAIVADRLRVSVAALDFSGLVPRLRVTLSAGVATACGGDAGALLSAADKLLYEAKDGGRNQIRVAQAN